MFDQRFRGLFWTQFLGAFNDNLFKNALVLLVLYRLAEGAGPLLVTAAAGIFILPFFVFSAQAGTLADAIDKARLARATKLAEIGTMAAGALALLVGDVPFLLVVLFLMGAQSAVFGPVKFGILPDLLPEGRIVAANGLIEAATFLAILTGTILGGVLILKDGGPALVAGLVVACAIAGYLTSRAIPAVPPRDQGLRIPINPLAAIGPTFAALRRDRRLWRAALAVSWFWFVGAIYLAQIPTLVKVGLGANEGVVTLFLTLFSLGIGLGSLAAGRLTHGRVRLTLVPLAGLGIALFTLDFVRAIGAFAAGGGTIGPLAFLQSPEGLRVAVDLVGLAAAGGLFVVPLMAAIQTWAGEGRRARVIAGLNIVNAGFMVLSSLVTLALQALGFEVSTIILLTGLMTLPVCLLVLRLIPAESWRTGARRLLKILLRVEVRGEDHLTNLDGPAVVVANHVSLLDGPLLLAFLRHKPVFAIDGTMAARWWVRPFLRFAEALPLDPTNPLALRRLSEAVRGGRSLVIFPEGRITVNGGLMRVQDGPAMIADRAGVPVVPVHIKGAEQSYFSRLRPGMTRRRLLPRVTIEIGAPQHLDLDPDLKGKARREAGGRRLYDLMCEHVAACGTGRHDLFGAVWDAARYHGMGRTMVEDASGQSLTYRRLLASVLALRPHLDRACGGETRVGVLLPNSAAAVVTVLALAAAGRQAAMLNLSTGATPMLASLRTAAVRTIVTARRFVEAAGLEDTVADLERAGVCVVHLEALREDIGARARLAALSRTFLPRPPAPADPDDPAVVLFTSGSEGSPKGVVLSHTNLIADARQGAVLFDITHEDKTLAVLPLFHSFGLISGLTLPLLTGMGVFLYPSPLHYRKIPAVAYDVNATVLFGTDTFLMGYGRKADGYDFQRLRYVVAGGEPVRDETRTLWAERFGLRILEGYGLTEASPVVALNTPLHYRPGTVGRPLPRVEHRIEPVEGLETGGRLWIKGPNVMVGYLLPDAPGVVQPTVEGWHDTGDIVAFDADGFVHVTGRAKRFAKLGGEMVSLGLVEAEARLLWPDATHAVIAARDARKGERLVLYTTMASATRRALHEALRRRGLSELLLPAEIHALDELPLLASGKVDYVTLGRERAAAGSAHAA